MKWYFDFYLIELGCNCGVFSINFFRPSNFNNSFFAFQYDYHNRRFQYFDLFWVELYTTL